MAHVDVCKVTIPLPSINKREWIVLGGVSEDDSGQSSPSVCRWVISNHDLSPGIDCPKPCLLFIPLNTYSL